MISSRTVLLIASGLAAARAQGIGSLPTADIACAGRKLAPRVDRVNSLCCGDGRAECACTIACSSALLPLLDECRTVLDIMLDIGDGVRDGVAGQLDVLKAQCLDMPPALVLLNAPPLPSAPPAKAVPCPCVRRSYCELRTF